MHKLTYPICKTASAGINSAKMLSLAFMMIFLLNACEKDDDPLSAPLIRLLDKNGMVNSDTTVSAGSLLSFAIEAEGRGTNLTNLILLVDNGESSQRYLDTSMNIREFSLQKSFSKSLSTEETWTFIVRDKNRLSDSVSLVITLDTTAGFGPVKYLEGILLSAQNNSESGNFFSCITDQAYTLNEASQNQELIDLVYFYGEDENTMGSPGANIEDGIFEGNLEDWSIRRTSRFIELNLSEEDFYQFQNDSLLVASYTEGSGKRKAKLLAPGKTFAFKTEDFKYGIFLVREVSGTDAGTVLFDIKIQDK